MQKHILFTKRGYEEKQKEYAELLASRPDAVKEVTKARDMGDLSENGYYKGARFKLSDIDRKLRQLKHLLRVGNVQETTLRNVVDIGVTITVQTTNQTKTFTIVGTYESDPTHGKISPYSPLGKLLMGKRVGESVNLAIGNNETTYTITSIT